MLGHKDSQCMGMRIHMKCNRTLETIRSEVWSGWLCYLNLLYLIWDLLGASYIFKLSGLRSQYPHVFHVVHGHTSTNHHHHHHQQFQNLSDFWSQFPTQVIPPRFPSAVVVFVAVVSVTVVMLLPSWPAVQESPASKETKGGPKTCRNLPKWGQEPKIGQSGWLGFSQSHEMHGNTPAEKHGFLYIFSSSNSRNWGKVKPTISLGAESTFGPSDPARRMFFFFFWNPAMAITIYAPSHGWFMALF